MSWQYKLNEYICDNGHSMVTIDRDQGVTPFVIMCRKKGCKQRAISLMYKVNPKLVPEFEWYKSVENTDGVLMLRKIEN
jgi:hypothetical protein